MWFVFFLIFFFFFAAWRHKLHFGFENLAIHSLTLFSSYLFFSLFFYLYEYSYLFVLFFVFFIYFVLITHFFQVYLFLFRFLLKYGFYVPFDGLFSNEWAPPNGVGEVMLLSVVFVWLLSINWKLLSISNCLYEWISFVFIFFCQQTPTVVEHGKSYWKNWPKINK